MVCGPSRQVCVELLDDAQQAAQLGPRGGRDGAVPSSSSSAPVAVAVGVSPVSTSRRTTSRSGSRLSKCAMRVTWRISSASRRQGPAVIIRVRAGPSCGLAMARRPCSRSRISGMANRESPPTTVYGMSSSWSRATMASRCWCLRYRTAVAPGLAGVVVLLHGVHDRHRLVLRPGADHDLHLAPVLALRAQPLVRFEADEVAQISRFAAASTCPASGSSPRSADGRRAGRGPVGVVGGRLAEAPVELREGREAGAAEAVDGLVVVPHHHDVVRAIRRAPQQLDQLDLGDVRVLELVHQQVAELALPPAQDVRAALEEADDRGDLLAKVQRAPPRDLLLVRVIDRCDLAPAA